MFEIDERPAVYKSSFHEIAVVVIIMITQCLNVAGSNQTLPMMNVLADSFNNTTESDKVWFLAAFPLTAGTFILISGKFGDIFGLKKVFLYGAVWSIVWTLITGLSLYSKNVVFFCICRSFHGIGVSFMLPNGIGIVGNIYPVGQRKALVFCLIAASAPFGAFAGCIFGGLVANYDKPEWAFYANSICLALVFVAAWKYLPVVPRHEFTDNGERNTMDWIGAILGVVGMVLFNFAWNQAPKATWKNPYIITTLVLGIIFLVAFFQYEIRVKNPLLPKEVMNIHTGTVLLILALGWASFSTWGFYYFSFLLNLRKYSPFLSGLTYIPFMIFGIVAALVVSVLIRRTKSSNLLLASAIAFFLGITLLATTPVHQSFFQMMLPQMIILSFGMDLSFPAASLILSDSLPKKHQGIASSLVSTTTNYSMSIGLGVAGIAEVQTSMRNGGDLLRSYRSAMYVGIGFSSLGVLLACALRISQSFRKSSSNDNEQDIRVQNIESRDTKAS